MDAMDFGEVTVTPQSGMVWAVTFNTSPNILGWVIESGSFFQAVSHEAGDLGQQTTIKRAAHLVAVS